MKFVDGLFGVRKHFSDGGQVACGHVAGERIDALRVATVPLQFFAHVFDRRFVAAGFDIEDWALVCVNGDSNVFVPTPKECLIHSDGADNGKIHTIYLVMHPRIAASDFSSQRSKRAALARGMSCRSSMA